MVVYFNLLFFTFLSIHGHYDYVFVHGLSFSPRSVSGLDKEPDLVHMEAHTPDGSECPEHTFALKSNNKQGLFRNELLPEKRRRPQGKIGLPHQ